MAGKLMIGIILTLIAVVLLICFAFHYADHPSGSRSKTDVLFYAKPKGLKKDYRREDR
jgi:hypothetical protein